MMLKGKLVLIDYVGQSNEQGKPVGHPVKALKETIELVDKIINVELIIPKNYEEEFSDRKKNIKFFLNHYCQTNINRYFKRAACFFGKISNLIKIFRHTREGIMWFINSDFLLFVYLFFSPFKIKNKILLTLYREGYDNSGLKGKIKNYFFKLMIDRVDLVIKNSNKINVGSKEIFIPDYYYQGEHYNRYMGGKKNFIICVGIMTQEKDLLNLVKVCLNADIELKIMGFFPDKNLLPEIKKYAGKRIEILDKYLTTEEYYKAIAGAKFSILPYRKSSYQLRTSGILLESIFLNTLVIAPHFLLDYSNLPGLGYNNLGDIKNIVASLDDKKLAEIKKRMQYIRDDCSFEKIRGKIYKTLKNLTGPGVEGERP